jgi:O-acetylhomoserine (thiol)-lyase
MRDLGSTPSPQNAFYLNLGLETLHLRMERHTQNAMKVAKWLENNEQVEWVNYPGLAGNRYYGLAEKYLPNGTSGVISFGVKGGRDAAMRFMDSLNWLRL